MFLAAVHFHGQRAPVGVAQRGLEGFRKPLLGVGLDLQAVDHDLDRVLAVPVESRKVVDLVHGAVYPQSHEPLGAQILEQLRLLALAPRDER